MLDTDILCLQENYKPAGDGVPAKCGFNFGFLLSSTSYDAIFDSRGVYLP